jgi:hypothetical protein
VTKPGSDDSDHEWKERRINYFEKFAKEKRPLKHDYHHRKFT